MHIAHMLLAITPRLARRLSWTADVHNADIFEGDMSAGTHVCCTQHSHSTWANAHQISGGPMRPQTEPWMVTLGPGGGDVHAHGDAGKKK